MKVTLKVPSDALVVMVGPAGCGKSTLAKKLFGPESVVSSDHCRFLVCGDEARQDISYQSFTLFHTWISLRLSIGKLTVADATSLKRDSRRTLHGLAMKWHRPCYCILVDVPLDEVLRRNSSRSRVVPEHAVRKHYSQFLQAKKSILESTDHEFFDHVHLFEDGQDLKIEIVE